MAGQGHPGTENSAGSYDAAEAGYPRKTVTIEHKEMWLIENVVLLL